MKICLLGEYSGDFEEGMKNTTFYLSQELIKYHEVLLLNPRDIFSINFWKKIKKFNSQIIHYVPGPSVKSFVVVKALAFYCRNAKTVMSAIHPHLSSFPQKIIPLLKPDLMLVQSIDTEKMFNNLGCETKFLPSGVDVKRFVPVSIKEKLREKYGIEKSKFVVLHAGSIKAGRGIEIFKKIQGEGNQVIILGNKSMGVEEQIYRSIEESGCKVWVKYFKDVEEIYALSDCYIFPTPPMNKLNSIEIPLSVLEAMSCNLPVITTKFGALARIFDEGEGLLFIDKEEEFTDALEKVKTRGIKDIKTRGKVLLYSWENVCERLEKIYEGLVFNKDDDR